ncbi:unnamed protein product [Choristocarpus tenellus]
MLALTPGCAPGCSSRNIATDSLTLLTDPVAFLPRQARVLFSLNHDNIVAMWTFYENPKEYCLATEVLKGGELFDDIVRRSFYTEACARRIIGQLLDAMSYMHRCGVVHRDIKPENILLVAPGSDTIKLVDFGFAKKLEPPKYKAVEPVGSPGYAAPEVLRRFPYGTKADCFSAGVITYILLAGGRG